MSAHSDVQPGGSSIFRDRKALKRPWGFAHGAALTGTLVALLFLACASLSFAGESYDATVVKEFHGFLIVTDMQCHSHDLAFSTSGKGSSLDSFWAWGAHHFNVHINSHFSEGNEYADDIFPRSGPSSIGKCASSEKTFKTFVDGRIASWSEGNAVGALTIAMSDGATREFSFLTGHEPPVNGKHLFCQGFPDSATGCSGAIRLIISNRTKVRIYYDVIDGPDGPSDDVVKIATL